MPAAARPTRTTIRELTDPRDPALAAAYRLLARNFTRGERVDRKEWKVSLRERAEALHSDLAWHLLVAEDPSGTVLGFVSGTYVGSVNVGVIGYLAIDSKRRAHGLGSRLRFHLRRSFERSARRVRGQGLDAILGEVSPSNPWLRRLATRSGVILLDFPYLQPRLRATDRPSPFTLYYEAIARPRKRIAVGELRKILFAIWRRVYRIPRPLDRPAFRAMLRSLEGRRTIGAAARPPAKEKR